MTARLQDNHVHAAPVPRARSLFWRWLAFNAVGAMGIGVQLATLMALTSWVGLNYLVATLTAVEASVLHNFLWHEHWTWADRTSGARPDVFKRLMRFNLANGALSIIGNLAVTGLLVEMFAMNYLVANLLAISACSILNFFASDRLVFGQGGQEPMAHRAGLPAGFAFPRTVLSATEETMPVHVLHKFTAPALLLVTALSLGQGTLLEAAELRPETMKAWASYAQATERRIAGELASQSGFLALDFQPANAAAADRKAVLAGRLPISGLRTVDSSGEAISVPSGMIHHWRGSVFIPGAALSDVLLRVQNPTAENTKQEDVLASSVLLRGPDSLKLYLRLQRAKFVTVVYNTEHLVRYTLYGVNRASSSSVATKIAELENPNTMEEREKPEGRDRGFLWRLNSYWRYEQANGGVIVECESISLSRTVPAVLEFFIRPLIDKVARESMERTLASLRDRTIRSQREKSLTRIASKG